MNDQLKKTDKSFIPACPIPISQYSKILVAHGGGGKLMHDLLEKIIIPTFNNPELEARHDGAIIELGKTRLAFTTDSYVVKPLFFPGSDIGALAVNGTVNDLAMCGARPLYLSAGFILEEGLSMDTLWRIVQSMQRAAEVAGVKLITGDTKVVDKGKGDDIFINTAGIGIIEHGLNIGPSSIKPGDVIIINGDIGRHGMAIMSAREGLNFESTIESDCAPLNGLVLKLIESGVEIHCLRDLTRGGLASALVEIAETSNTGIEIEENAIPVRNDVRGACEILGLDPIYVANEGRMAIFVKSTDAKNAFEIINSDPFGINASIIGTVTDKHAGMVTIKSSIGISRIVDMISGEQLPRIC
jgi:hydrogenase expression/formation protein HypE